MASSLNLLLTSSRKGQFRWNKEARVAFMTLKQAMTTTSVLAMPNFNKSFIIEMEAAEEGIGAVLTQQGKLVAFISRALGVIKKSWLTYAKEIHVWRPYLLGRKFFIQTIQHSLKYFLEQRLATSKQQK